MLNREITRNFANWVRRCVIGSTPWTQVYGTARSLFAAATGLTLLLNPVEVLHPLADVAVVGGSALASISLFQLLPCDMLGVAQVIAGLALLGIATGWRPRYTGIIHWWLTFSFSNGYQLIDGGDQLASILTLLLIPVTINDPRRWHWSPPDPAVRRNDAASVVASFCLGVIRVQIAGVYFHASVAKFSVSQWTDGTALYYWLLHPLFGSPDWLRPVLTPVLLFGPAVTLLTWSVLILEFVLAAGLIADRVYRPWMFVGGLALHLGIILVHGLFSFGLIMFGALILFLVPREALSFGTLAAARRPS